MTTNDIDRIREAYAQRVTRAEQKRSDDIRKARAKRTQEEQDIHRVAAERAREVYEQARARLTATLESLDAGTRAALAHSQAECAKEEDRAEKACHAEVQAALTDRTEAVIALYKPPEESKESFASRHRQATERGTIGGTEEADK